MNKYIIPICDCQEFTIDNHIITATSFEDCENKLMDELCDEYEFLPTNVHYTDFLKACDKHDICIGEIKDIEEY